MLVYQRVNNGINHHKPLVIRNSLAHPPYLTGLVGLAVSRNRPSSVWRFVVPEARFKRIKLVA